MLQERQGALTGIEKTLKRAYDGQVTVVPSSLLTGPPDLNKYDDIADTFEDNSGKRLDAFGHSSGMEDLRRGWEVHKGRKPNKSVDMRAMHVVAIEPIQDPSNLVHSMNVYLGFMP